jgi:CubicO group peptidase (beta-lactamase class C family)
MKIVGIILLSIILIAIMLFLYLTYKVNNFKDSYDLANSIDKQADKFIEQGNANALVVGVFKDGKTYLKGYGTIEIGKKIPPDGNTIFELASTSKLFTTSTLQILADEGLLNLDDKINDLLDEKLKLPLIAQNTNLLHLATHTSGFQNLPNSFLDKMKDVNNPYKDLVANDLYEYLVNCDGKKSEGGFDYSNFGMGLLGHILEIRTGEKYEQLVKESTLKPLSMQSTFITIDSNNSKQIVQGYNENAEKAPIWTDNVLTGAGSFLSNANDMIKFIKANLSVNESSISKSLIKTHEPKMDGETSLGWMLPGFLDKLAGNKNMLWHNGMAGGYASFIAIDKVHNYGIIILSNKAIDVTNFGMKLTLSARTQSWKD